MASDSEFVRLPLCARLIPYGELTSPDSYSARIPLKRFLKRYMSTRQQYKIEDGNNFNKQEEGEDEAISKAYMFDPDILKSTHLGRVLLKPFNSTSENLSSV